MTWIGRTALIFAAVALGRDNLIAHVERQLRQVLIAKIFILIVADDDHRVWFFRRDTLAQESNAGGNSLVALTVPVEGFFADFRVVRRLLAVAAFVALAVELAQLSQRSGSSSAKA